MEKRLSKIITVKAGGTAAGNAKTYKISIPKKWVNEMNTNDNKVELSFDGNSITISPILSADEFVQKKLSLKHLPKGQEWVFDMVNNILIEVLGTIAEQERQTIRKRQREGIDAAKAKGKHLGRPKLELPENYDAVIAQWRAKDITARQRR